VSIGGGGGIGGAVEGATGALQLDTVAPWQGRFPATLAEWLHPATTHTIATRDQRIAG